MAVYSKMDPTCRVTSHKPHATGLKFQVSSRTSHESQVTGQGAVDSSLQVWPEARRKRSSGTVVCKKPLPLEAFDRQSYTGALARVSAAAFCSALILTRERGGLLFMDPAKLCTEEL